MVRAIAAALPAGLMTLGLLAFIVMESSGRTPLSLGPPRNIAEAAGLANAAETLRFLSAGADPTRVLPIRPEILSSAILQLTALEAAVWSRQIALVQLLDEYGVIVGDERHRLACLAADLPAEDIRMYLAAPGAPACAPQRILDSVVARRRTGD
jgi:hypothetical protein